MIGASVLSPPHSAHMVTAALSEQRFSMTLPLDSLLESYREAAGNERDKGTYYERLCAAFLLHDPVQAQRYDEVQTWADWAADHGWNGKDVGIDLVARLRGHAGFAAIQCKFYAPRHKIAKADIDSFLAASSRPPFTDRIVMDSTEGEWVGQCRGHADRTDHPGASDRPVRDAGLSGPMGQLRRPTRHRSGT